MNHNQVYGGPLTSGTPGYGRFFYDLAAAKLTVDNYDNAYVVEVRLDATSPVNRVRAVNVYYILQVSPPPEAPSFIDVPPGHPFYQHIEALAASGITDGCTVDQDCPDAPLTRGQMAVFPSKALGLHGA
ncbi:MAG: S-layer homology domain-containing protein, partial [Acidobacteria bacterium]|nr:S-layer homology domain-containing protein [Acidobacteriota bacterium]MDW7985419.1 S-layer homology domain-containing protein [Acidobacteriota bacterium]